jgi:ribosome recycling factor
MQQYEERMKKAIEAIERELQTFRTGRANPNILDRIYVDYYGSQTPLKSLANITVPEGRTLQINPFDMSALVNIEKAILESDLGFNPTNDGSKLMITIPELTKERRQEMVKLTKKAVEDGKVSIRNARRDALNDAKKDEEMTEDDQRAYQNDIQKLTDKYVAKADELASVKEKELMTI